MIDLLCCDRCRAGIAYTVQKMAFSADPISIGDTDTELDSPEGLHDIETSSKLAMREHQQIQHAMQVTANEAEIKKQDTIALDDFLRSQGRRRIEIDQDGHCLFRSLMFSRMVSQLELHGYLDRHLIYNYSTKTFSLSSYGTSFEHLVTLRHFVYRRFIVSGIYNIPWDTSCGCHMGYPRSMLGYTTKLSGG